MDSETKNVLFGLIDHRLPLGVLGLDRTGRVVTQNHAAQSMLARGDGLFLLRGHLVAARSAESTGLRRLVLDACTRNGEGGRAGGVLEVSRMSSSRPFGVLVAPLHAGGRPRVNGLPAAVAFITDPDNQAQTWRELLHHLYGLTAAETEVGLLSLGGNSITEIDELRGVTLHTDRTHLRQVFPSRPRPVPTEWPSGRARAPPPAGDALRGCSSLATPRLIRPYAGVRGCAASSPAGVRDRLRRIPLPSCKDRMKAA